MPEMSRRRLLGSAGGVTGAALASTLLPPNVRKALAAGPATRGSLRDIKHVVLLMQENRSFDHYFGTLAGVAGFDDPDAIKLDTGKSVFYQPDAENPEGYLLPFQLDTHEHQRAEDPVHQPRLGGAAPGVERRQDGPVAAGAPQGRRRQRPLRDGLPHARGHPVPVRARRGVHHLRRLPLLGHRADLAEPDVSG